MEERVKELSKYRFETCLENLDDPVPKSPYVFYDKTIDIHPKEIYNSKISIEKANS